MSDSGPYKREKLNLLIGVGLMACIFGAVEMLLAKWEMAAGLIAIFAAVGGVTAILLWIKIDSNEHGTEVSGQFRLLIIVLGIFALIYYLFRSRGLIRGLKSTGLAVLYFVGVYLLQIGAASLVMFAMFMVGSYTSGGVVRSLRDGNEAFQSKNYDLAIAKYEEGIKADPEYVGTAPSLHINSAMARMSRAVETYNRGIKVAEPANKASALKSCRKDLADAANDLADSWRILKQSPASDIYDRNQYEAAKQQTIRGAKDTFQMAVRTQQVDRPVIDAAIVLVPEYLALENDPSKRSEARLIIADLYRVSGDSEHAVEAYKAVLQASPDDADALAGAGFSLVNLSYQNGENAKMLEGLEYLRKFVAIAPDGHKLKTDAQSVLDSQNTRTTKRLVK